MILISLDEYGNFEKKDEMPVFIAGIIYDDCGDKTDLEDEKERIREYYKRVIAEAKATYSKEKGQNAIPAVLNMFRYPEALHCNDALGKDQNSVVKRVKICVKRTLPEFIRSCSYNNKKITYNPEESDEKRERKGKYHLFIMLKSKDGMTSLMGNTNNLINDNYATNLYFHMAGRVVNRLIFHNPLYPDKMPAIKLNIATRSSADCNKMDPKLVKQLDSLLYEKKGNGANGQGHFSLMNADMYRTLIAQEMLRCSSRNIKISGFDIYPIKYELLNENVFEYLADSVCSYIAQDLKSKDGTYIKEVNLRVNRLNPDYPNMVFAYDEIDNYYEEAVESIEKKDIYEAFSAIRDAEGFEGVYAEFYKKHLLALLRNYILETSDPNTLDKAVDDLARSVYTSNLSQEKLKYIFDWVEKIATKGKCKYISNARKEHMLFKIWETGIAAYSHIGDPFKAIDYYNKCLPLFKNEGIEARIRLNNKLVVAMEDLFALDNAEAQAIENIVLEKKKEALLGVGSNGNQTIVPARGKALSQYARVLASKRDAKAEQTFREALLCFEKGTADYKITQSYLCHFLADMADYNNDKKYITSFEKEATDFFDGNSTYENRLGFVNGLTMEKEALINKKYAYYVLFRGLYVGYRVKKISISNALWSSIKATGFTVSETLQKKKIIVTHGHPWEIIYKYLGLLAAIKGDDEYEQYCLDQLSKCLTYKGKIIEALMMFGEIQYNMFLGDKLAWGNMASDLASFLTQNFVVFKNRTFAKNKDKLYKELSDIFTFMYY